MKTIAGQGRWRGAAALAACLLLAGCGGGGTTPDGGEPPVISFTPAAQGQQLMVGQSLAFAAGVQPEGALTVAWRRGGVVVGSARQYTYEGALVGRDTLRVHAEAGDAARDFFWVVDVQAEPLTVPPDVPTAAADPGPDPVQVKFMWTRVGASTYPITDYVIALSYTGPVTSQNWDAARVLANVPHVPGQVGYFVYFDRVNAELVAGAEAWFGIRARDDHGQLSTGVRNAYTRITTEWWIDGRVTDDLGIPLEAVSVGSASPARNGNTDVSGLFSLGPYRSVDLVTVQTTTVDHYDFTTAPLSSAVDVELGIVLPGKYGVDPHCTAYDGDFLVYLRHMTRTTPSEIDTSASRLWKWDHYPVSVFLPDSTTASGRDLDGLARAMLDLWNLTMGETYLVETGSAETADVHLDWVTDASAGYGETALELPVGGVLGDVRPQRMRVEIETGILTDQFFQEVALHEFGHVLGLVEHSVFCQDAGHLMVFGASGNLSLAQPIHPDEVRAVRTVRRLPQGVDMRRYVP